MRTLLASVIVVIFAVSPAMAAPTPSGASNSTIFQWIQDYREKPVPSKVPAIVKDMSRFGAFRDPEQSGFYIGFVAGVLSGNPKTAGKLAEQMLPLPEEDSWVVVRAVAWSELPGRYKILGQLYPKLPARQAMINKYLGGELPTLFEATEIPPPPPRGLKALFKKDEEQKPLPTADDLDALWGFYLATNSDVPIHRLITFLPLADNKNEVDRLALGGMAKYMLASAAVRDTDLLATLKEALPGQDEKTSKELTEVIDAAEGVDAGRIKEEQLAALEELKVRGPHSRRQVSKWGRIGEGAISLGCIAAAAAGQVYLGIPCVVGGAVSSAALRYWATQD